MWDRTVMYGREALGKFVRRVSPPTNLPRATTSSSIAFFFFFLLFLHIHTLSHTSRHKPTMNYYGSSPSSTTSTHSTSYPPGSYSRPSSVSPQFSNAYIYSSKARFNASRGFDVEDDLEFCPALRKESKHIYEEPEETSTDEVVTTPQRVRKVIEIVDPTTGMKIGS